MNACMNKEFTQTPGYLIHEISRFLNREYDHRMSELGLTRAQWWVLAMLHFNNGVTQSELAAELGFGKAALGLLLDRLEKKGWLKRKPHAADRRAKCIFRTAKTKSLTTRMQIIAVEMNTDLVAGLSKKEQASLIRMLQTVRNNLSND